MTRRFAVAVLGAAFCSAAGACGAGNGDGKAAGRSLLELRPLVQSIKPPCPEKPANGGEIVLPLQKDGTVSECLELARPIVDAENVVSATVADTPSQEPALSVVLGATGSANLDGFAQRNLGDRLAIVTAGRLVSAPKLNDTAFAGRIQVTGLSKQETEDLFRRLNKLIKK